MFLWSFHVVCFIIYGETVYILIPRKANLPQKNIFFFNKPSKVPVKELKNCTFSSTEFCFVGTFIQNVLDFEFSEECIDFTMFFFL